MPRCRLSERRMFIKTSTLLSALLVAFLSTKADFARAEATAPHDSPVAGHSLKVTIAGSSESAPYCSELKHVAVLATTKERFSVIAGTPRDGNFVDTSLPLPGWKDCSVYGGRIYTCDSRAVGTEAEAEAEQARIVTQIKACLGAGWAEAKDRSSSNYTVLHDGTGLRSITISTEAKDRQEYVIRLILFLRKPI